MQEKLYTHLQYMVYGPELAKGHDHESEIYAKDSWYTAYIKAGSLIPQVRFGPHLHTLEAVLPDLPDIGWQTVVLSKLTDAQWQRSGTVMNNLHAGAGIDLFTADLPSGIAPLPERRIITPEDLQREWQKTTHGLQYSVYGFFTNRPLPNDRNTSEMITQMNAILYDPNTDITQLRRIVEAGCNALNETQILAELFRLGYSSPAVRTRQLAEKKQVYAQYFDLYGLTEEMIESPDIVLEKIVGRVKEAFLPYNDQRSEWLIYGTGLKVGE